jgi:hypothetical protein
MLTQLEFREIIDAVGRGETPAPHRHHKDALNIVNFSLGLAQSLSRYQLSPAIFNVITSVARATTLTGHATIPQIAADCGITFNAVHQHLQPAKSGHLFHQHRTAKDGTRFPMLRITLTNDATAIFAKVLQSAKRYAKYPVH